MKTKTTFHCQAPRPAVLPLEPSPRPTRVRAVFDPRAGRRSCSLIVISCHLQPTPPRRGVAPPQSAPRVCGLSSRITECRIRRSPSVRRLSR